MEERKNIERFFQEKFKNFEAAPPENLWKDIDKSLNKKSNKRKVIPLWWKIAGAAALLAGFLWTGNLIFSPNSSNTIQSVTDTETMDSISGNKAPNESVVSGDDNENQINTTPSNPTTDSKSNKESDVINKSTIGVEQEVAQQETQDSKTKNHLAKENDQVDIHVSKNEAIAQVQQKDLDPTQDSIVTDPKHPAKATNGTIPTDYTIDSKQAVVETNVKATDTIQDNSKKPSLLEAVEEMKKSKQEALASNDEDKNSLRWSVQPNVAPVYYNTLSEGSPLSQQFAENSKQGDVTISFGVNIAYQISKRLSIRSGLNSVDMGYATDGIEFGPAISSTQQHQLNVRFNSPNGAQQPNIALSDGKTPLYTPDSELQARSENSYQGSINQKFGYLEIPLELKYRLIDSKFGVNIIGGFSSLFLTDNKVTISSDNNLKSEVGEASNLNNTSFSTNIGVGLDYQFSEKLLFNLEPMFKYQMGTFSSDDGGFSPYMLGVYTGLSFSF